MVSAYSPNIKSSVNLRMHGLFKLFKKKSLSFLLFIGKGCDRDHEKQSRLFIKGM